VIEGVVFGSTDAIVALTVHGPEGQAEHVDFKVDTGFDGALTLHSAVVAALGLSRRGTQDVVLADGGLIRCAVCDGFVEWAGVPRSVRIQVADSISLLGMALMTDHQLRIDVVDGGAVRITPLTASQALPGDTPTSLAD
jgi:clan AA aspartic protease